MSLNRIIPRRYTCLLCGAGCSYEKCTLYRPYSIYIRNFTTCSSRSQEPQVKVHGGLVKYLPLRLREILAPPKEADK